LAVPFRCRYGPCSWWVLRMPDGSGSQPTATGPRHVRPGSAHSQQARTARRKWAIPAGALLATVKARRSVRDRPEAVCRPAGRTGHRAGRFRHSRARVDGRFARSTMRPVSSVQDAGSPSGHNSAARSMNSPDRVAMSGRCCGNHNVNGRSETNQDWSGELTGADRHRGQFPPRIGGPSSDGVSPSLTQWSANV